MNEKNIGSILSKLREEKGLTQKELADKLNISDKTISKWETGANLPNIDMIYRISQVFKVSFQNLLKARLEEEKIDEKLIKDIMNEFTETNKRKIKLIKIGFIIALVISLILIIAIIFTNTYNRFKVYDIGVNKSNILEVDGVYVETRIKDLLSLNKIKIKGRDIQDSDTVSVDIYFIENEEKKVIYTSSELTGINFSNYQTYIKIKDLTKYIDNLYIRVTIINNKNKVEEYEEKLKFEKDFSNNKIYNNEITENYNVSKLDKDYVKEKLLTKGFEAYNDKILIRNSKTGKMSYYYGANKIIYSFEKNNFSYRYTYFFDLMYLEVLTFDENNTEVDNYKYDVYNNQIVICKTGSCNNYDTAMKILNEEILDYLYER